VTESIYNGNCLVVSAIDITLDCRGNIIDGMWIDDEGILAVIAQNFLLKNCLIRNFTVGVDFQDVSINALNNTLTNGLIGINVASGGVVIEKNVLSGFSYAVNDYAGNSEVKSNYFSENMYDYQGSSIFPSLIFNNSFSDGTSKILGTINLINNWNITAQAGIRIVGNGLVGGNYWGNCADADQNGFCDSFMIIDSNNTDYLPLSTYYVPPAPALPQLPSITDMNLLIKNYQCSGNYLDIVSSYGYCINTTCGTTNITASQYCDFGCDSSTYPFSCKPSPTQAGMWFFIIIIICVVLMVFLIRWAGKRI
jgi:hypothetical protein